MAVFLKADWSFTRPLSYCLGTGLVTMLEVLLYSLGYSLLVIEQSIAEHIVSTFLSLLTFEMFRQLINKFISHNLCRMVRVDEGTKWAIIKNVPEP